MGLAVAGEEARVFLVFLQCGNSLTGVYQSHQSVYETHQTAKFITGHLGSGWLTQLYPGSQKE